MRPQYWDKKDVHFNWDKFVDRVIDGRKHREVFHLLWQELKKSPQGFTINDFLQAE